jgi:hypothetical protein
MKKLTLLCLCFLTAAFFAGCKSTSNHAARPKWNNAEIVGIVFANPDVRHDWMVRDMGPTSPDTLVVWLGDVGENSTDRQAVVLKLQADGTWKVVKVENHLS